MKNTSTRRRSRTTFRPRLESLEVRLTPTTYTVSSLADSGADSLRAAITSANADTTADEIDFSVAGVIQLTSGALPAITNTVKIDGTTAPGFSNAPVVEIDNNGFAGLTLSGSNSTLASLSIVNANGAGVTLNGQYGSGDGGPITGQSISVVGNYIGLALGGAIAANTGYGVQINDSESTIGGTMPADRNVISGNGAGGLQIDDGPGSDLIGLPTGAVVEGNYIGTDPSGQSAAPNQGNGITIVNAGSAVGGTNEGAGNVIAFNTQSGVVMNGVGIVLSNSIFNNGLKGIDNEEAQFGYQNLPAPQLSYAVESPGSSTGSVQVQVGGVLNVASVLPSLAPGFTCTIQVFATLQGVRGGQGQLFLGSVQVTPNANGFATFILSNASVPAGSATTFTATATSSSTAGTSEFSQILFLGGNANNLYVASVYGLLLHRYPDPGAQSWSGAMDNGDSAAGVALGIQESPEYPNDQVTAMYEQYLQRQPDTVGAQYWVNVLQSGGTLEEVAEGLTSSQEYYILQGGTNQGFITGLYQEVLKRTPSTGELAGWETAMNNGASQSEVSIAFLTSQEYRTDLVEGDYMTFLLRSADSGGLAAWVNALNAGATDQQVLAQIFGSAEGYQLWS